MITSYNKFLNENTQFSKLNSMIDYTSLTGQETEEDIKHLCNKAQLLQVKSICIYPKWVKTASECLKDSNVLVCTVISFPKGTDKTEAKITETKKAINDGADEIDIVIDYKSLKKVEGDNEEEDFKIVEEIIEDIEGVKEVCKNYKNKENKFITLKVIIESGELTIPQTELATKMCIDAEADFIKTSTGKVQIGAELNKVAAIYDVIKEEDEDLKIKASGGIRNLDDMNAFLKYVDRFGIGFNSVDQINGLTAIAGGGNY